MAYLSVWGFALSVWGFALSERNKKFVKWVNSLVNIVTVYNLLSLHQLYNFIKNMSQTASITRPLWKRILQFLLRSFLWIFGFLIFWIVLLKWMPILFTPTMLLDSLSAWATGKDARIYYEWKSYEAISDHVKVAVVASEDQRFPTHGGLDFAAIKQAMEENKLRSKKRGASTISQQVAKNVFLWQGGGYVRKALEVPITYLIEFIWGKKRILEVYLNIAEMGPQTYGVQAASKRFYQKNAQQLTALEAARIAAVLPNPKVYLIQNPSPTVIYRQNHTLYQMQLLGGISYLKDL